MNLAGDDERTRKFVTNLGLITSSGPHGPNIMAAEWTHHISHAPSLIAICIHAVDATAENIDVSREFGVNICASDQASVASIAGGSHGNEVDKIGVLQELGIELYKGKKINAPMVKGAVMNAECRLLGKYELGDHLTYVGEVIEISALPEKQPLVYHNGRYWNVGERIEKPPQETLDRIRALVEKYKKGSGRKH